jgi:hypothetical protein
MAMHLMQKFGGSLFIFLCFFQMTAYAETYTSTKTFDSSQSTYMDTIWVQEIPNLPAGANIQSVKIELNARVKYWGIYQESFDLLGGDSNYIPFNDDGYQICQLTRSTHPSTSQFYIISCELKSHQLDWVADDSKLNLSIHTSYSGMYSLDYAKITVETGPVEEEPPPVEEDAFTSTKIFDKSHSTDMDTMWVQEVPNLPADTDIQSVKIELNARTRYWGIHQESFDLLCGDSDYIPFNDDGYQVCQLTRSTHPSTSQFYTVRCELKSHQIDWLADDGKLNLSIHTSYTGMYSLDYAKITVETDSLQIVSVSPALGTIDQDLSVNIFGREFSSDMDAFVITQDDEGNPLGEVEVATIEIISDTEARLLIPARSEVGQYGLKLTKGEKTYTLQSAVSFLEDTAVDNQRGKKAIIVAGGGPYSGNALWSATRLCADTAYGSLVSQGYAGNTIQFLSTASAIDGDGDGISDVDGDATLAGLREAVQTWARTPVEPDVPVNEILIYMTGHGQNSVFELNEKEYLKAEELDAWLDDLQSAVAGHIIVVYDACLSGSFIPLLTPPEGYEAKRIVLTGASAGEKAWFVDDGLISFSFPFWSSVRDKGRLFASYHDGAEMVIGGQTARVDLDGDGTPDEVTPDLLNNDVVIGRGRVAASNQARIELVSADDIAVGCEGTSILASVTSAPDGVERVYARITTPENYELPTQPLLNSPMVNLTDRDADGVYECNYKGFTENGDYTAIIQAVDKKGVTTTPGYLTMRRDCPIGDLNGDGPVDLIDAVIGLQILSALDVSQSLRSDYAASKVDCDSDGKLGMAEIVFALRRAAGIN